jgi:pSer/pThr/pTyr-binding forkhead associated (FHA) protein
LRLTDDTQGFGSIRVVVRSLRIGHRRYVLSVGVNTIGREPSSTVCINDPSVSRGHARIIIENDEATLEDLASKNGTYVMGEPVKQPTRLNDGDELEFGHVKGWYIVETGDEPPTTTTHL